MENIQEYEQRIQELEKDSRDRNAKRRFYDIDPTTLMEIIGTVVERVVHESESESQKQ